MYSIFNENLSLAREALEVQNVIHWKQSAPIDYEAMCPEPVLTFARTKAARLKSLEGMVRLSMHEGLIVATFTLPAAIKYIHAYDERLPSNPGAPFTQLEIREDDPFSLSLYDARGRIIPNEMKVDEQELAADALADKVGHRLVNPRPETDAFWLQPATMGVNV